MCKRFQYYGMPDRQDGVAILAITVLLLLVATIGVIGIGRVGLMEQKVVGTDVRNKEVYSAAIGGLEYGIDWFEENYASLTWSDSDGDGDSEPGDTAAPTAAGNAVLNADTYARNVTYTLLTEVNPDQPLPAIVRVSSQAQAANDSHVQKTVTVDVMLGAVNIFSETATQGGNPSVFDGPPVMVEDCMSGVTGNPEIFPNGGIAVGTTKGNVGCVDPGKFNLHGGTIEALVPPMSLWQSVFGDATKDDLLAMEAESPATVLFVDGSYPHYPGQPGWNGNNWHTNWPLGFSGPPGPDDEPVILYFDSSVGCPKINGGTQIYGLVYYEATDCGNQGWGGGKVYGTVAKAGDMTKFTANAEIHGETLDFSGGTPPGPGGETEINIGFAVPKFSKIPGSWRDF